jgi:hypothetical protein
MARPAQPALPRAELPAPAKDQPPENWTTDEEVVRAYLSRLESLYRRRASCLQDPDTRWAELAELDGVIRRTLLGLSWLGTAAARLANVAWDEAESAGTSFAAAAIVLSTDAPDGRDGLIERWVKGSASPQKVAGIALAMRLAADPQLVSALEGLLARTHRPAVLSALLPILADHDRLTPEQLLPLLDQPVDTLADRAASLLAWLGRDGGHRSAVEDRALAWQRPAMLRAAACLGSASALALVRAAVDADGTDVAEHLETLALAGDPSDGVRLQRLTSSDGPVARLAAEVISFLGVDSAGSGGSRLLRGRPWRLAESLGRAVDASERLLTRRWCVMEALVRSGVRPVTVVYDPTASATRQQAAAEAVRNAFARERQLAPGRWHYFGRPST